MIDLDVVNNYTLL